MVGRLALLALVLLPEIATAQPQPAFLTISGGTISAALPVSILHDQNVRKQFASGLTTTFLITAKPKGGKIAGAVRVEIRYDLWDEVWIARRIDFDRKIETQRLPSMDALEKWWHMPARLMPGSSQPSSIDVELTVFPFSAAEEKDAREWISKSGGVTARGGGGLIDALIGTTLVARPITTYHWTAEVTPR